MQATELRIGNWYSDAFAGYTQVRAEDLPEWEAINCQPIPLTPEVLQEWCGFKFREHLDDFFIHLDRKLNSIIIVEKTGDVKVCNSNMLPVWLPVKHRYLHQLQNLYYALTGQELPVGIPVHS